MGIMSVEFKGDAEKIEEMLEKEYQKKSKSFVKRNKRKKHKKDKSRKNIGGIKWT